MTITQHLCYDQYPRLYYDCSPDDVAQVDNTNLRDVAGLRGKMMSDWVTSSQIWDKRNNKYVQIRGENPNLCALFVSRVAGYAQI